MMPGPRPAYPSGCKAEERANRPEDEYPRQRHATQEPKRDYGAKDRTGNSGNERVGENHRGNIAHRRRSGRFEHQRREKSRSRARDRSADGANARDQ